MNRQMKDSGIEWIGMIPEDWKIHKVKNIANIYTGNSIKDSDKDKYQVFDNSNPYIATKQIDTITSAVNYDDGIYIPKNDNFFKIAKKDSTLMCIEGGSAGKKIAFLNQDVAFVNKLCCFEPKKINSKFMYYYLKSPAFNIEFTSHITGLIGGVSKSEIKEFKILCPSIDEQKKIVNFLSQKISEIDFVINVAKETIEDYKKLAKLKLEFDLMDKDFKAQLKEAMESIGKDSVIRDGFSAKIKKGYTTKRFDSARFKKECPEIYEEYSKDSSVSSSITIDVE